MSTRVLMAMEGKASQGKPRQGKARSFADCLWIEKKSTILFARIKMNSNTMN